MAGDGLLICESDHIKLTQRGQILSNEVFERFLGVQAT
jgi:coproporphyrinogen III oxidase-like Fe-S oxidoreductase